MINEALPLRDEVRNSNAGRKYVKQLAPRIFEVSFWAERRYTMSSTTTSNYALTTPILYCFKKILVGFILDQFQKTVVWWKRRKTNWLTIDFRLKKKKERIKENRVYVNYKVYCKHKHSFERIRWLMKMIEGRRALQNCFSIPIYISYILSPMHRAVLTGRAQFLLPLRNKKPTKAITT